MSDSDTAGLSMEEICAEHGRVCLENVALRKRIMELQSAALAQATLPPERQEAP